MPELPEVETTVRGLRAVLEGRRIARVEARRADLRRPFPQDLRERVTGARVTSLGRRGKYGLIDTERGDTMIFHLGMSGSWRIDSDGLGKHDHLLLETDEGRRLVLNDPRRFGSIDLRRTDELDERTPFRELGPEPTGSALTGRWLKERFVGRSAPVKAMLTDQRIIAGLGNIYACEALFRAGIAPTRQASRISRERLDRLALAVHEVLDEAIAVGGSTLRNFAGPGGELGYFPARFAVYDREGKSCTSCGAAIRRITQGGRSSFYCVKCQR